MWGLVLADLHGPSRFNSIILRTFGDLGVFFVHMFCGETDDRFAKNKSTLGLQNRGVKCYIFWPLPFQITLLGNSYRDMLKRPLIKKIIAWFAGMQWTPIPALPTLNDRRSKRKSRKKKKNKKKKPKKAKIRTTIKLKINRR